MDPSHHLPHAVLAVLALTANPAWLHQAIPEIAKVVVAVITVGGALVGVWLGSRLTGVRERRARAEKQREDLLFLAVTVSATLEAFVSDCADASIDDGTQAGQLSRTEDGEEYRWPQVELPKLDFSNTKVEWTVLPPDLLDRLHAIPAKTGNLSRTLDAIAEYEWPHFDEYFATRRLRIARLGISAGRLSQEIRAIAGLKPTLDEEQTVLDWLIEREPQLRIEAEQVEAQRRIATEAFLGTVSNG